MKVSFITVYICTVMAVVQVPNAAQELSDLVTYCQATSFRSFDCSRQNGEYYAFYVHYNSYLFHFYVSKLH